MALSAIANAFTASCDGFRLCLYVYIGRSMPGSFFAQGRKYMKDTRAHDYSQPWLLKSKEEIVGNRYLFEYATPSKHLNASGAFAFLDNQDWTQSFQDIVFRLLGLHYILVSARRTSR